MTLTCYLSDSYVTLRLIDTAARCMLNKCECLKLFEPDCSILRDRFPFTAYHGFSASTNSCKLVKANMSVKLAKFARKIELIINLNHFYKPNFVGLKLEGFWLLQRHRFHLKLF